MANSRDEAEQYKLSLEHHMVPESRHSRKDRAKLKGHSSKLKEALAG